MNENFKLIEKDIVFLKEENYWDQMLNEVLPVLEKTRTSGYFKSYDQTELYYEFYKNPSEKATVVISHGFCEFTKKFEEVIYYFYQAGYSVYIYDHRGHGNSQRMVQDKGKVYIRSYDEYVLDMHSLITQIVLKDGLHKKLVLYAHSMGGAIGALYLEQYPGVFSCAILTSPMLDMDFGIIPQSIVGLVVQIIKFIRSEEAYVIGHKAFDGISVFDKSSCLSEERYNYIFSKRLQDENYQTYGASCAWALASLKAVRKLQKNAKLVNTPILLFQADKDTSVKAVGHRRFAKRAKDTKLVLISNSKHEIYNANSDIVEDYFHQIFKFLREKLGTFN